MAYRGIAAVRWPYRKAGFRGDVVVATAAGPAVLMTFDSIAPGAHPPRV